MAKRPYFYLSNGSVRKKDAEFEWFSGFSVSQKQKSIASMHSAVIRDGYHPLEVSTKSTSGLGRRLSAFSLRLDGYPLECVFQAGKKFEDGGPYTDILDMPPRDAKHDQRLKSSGRLKAFVYNEEEWPLEPRTAFYDYLYYCAARQCLTDADLKELSSYDAFTDIEFNPARSVNTQAGSVALVLSVYLKYGSLPDFTKSDFLDIAIKQELPGGGTGT